MNKIVEPKYKHKKAAKLKRFLATWLSHVRGQAGEGIMTALYTMMILAVIFFIGIDVAGYTGTVWKLRNACNETLTLMKMENGFDSNTAYVFYNFLRNQGLDPSRVNVTGTPKTVQRGDIVTITANTQYDLRALRPLNQLLSFEVRVQMAGMAQDFVR
ncbi:MAG: DUF4320 family protein [Peptococcia bacterium]